jgi:NifU-like protein involved in Fe-S cluster formation
MTAPLYTTQILGLAASLEAPHSLERVDGEVEIRSLTCGSRVATQVQLNSERSIEAVSQRVHACAFGQASAALLERHAIGKSHLQVSDALLDLTRWLDGEEDRTPDWPGFDALAPARTRRARHGAILLPFRALAAAIESAK